MPTVLVTGASSGIGKHTAKKLLAEGYTVYVAARRVEKMQDLAELGAHPLSMDVTDEAQVRAGIDRIEAAHGGVDILINNAGFGLYGAVEDVSIDDARYQFEVNLFGLARVTQAVLPWMREQKSGRIVNISSMGGKIYTPLGAWYHATKHALEGWSDCLRLELQPHGIHVIIIEPGVIGTEFGDEVTQPLLDRSGDGPYAELAEKAARATRSAYEKGDNSPPTVISDLIASALRAPNPRTRYSAGKYAWQLMTARAWLSDRMFDRLLLSQFG